MDRLRQRLHQGGAPLVVGPSPEDLFPNDDLGDAVRHDGRSIIELQRSIAAAGADALVAPTASTTAVALQRSGQAYRAAALTGRAVDLSREGAYEAGRAPWLLGAIVAGASSRAREEAALHVDRLAAAGVSGVLLRADDAASAVSLAPLLASHALVTFVEATAPIDEALFSAFPDAVFVLRAAPSDGIAAALERARTRAVAVGVRFDFSSNVGEAAIRAKAVASSLDLAVVGLGGEGALAALPAFVASA